MKRKINRQEKGVALLFALGLLALMLTVGMAFVANSVIARKVAANNSSRTQARMFALSAINRAAASVMLYQQQIWHAADQPFVDTFSAVYSYDSTHDRDQLLKKSKSDPLIKLPLDNSCVARSFAIKFNEPFIKGNWPGSWVYFYNTCNSSDPEMPRKIIGRAAWQVLSTSPSILAPVFFRGHLEADAVTPEWLPSQHRWGREIDEAFLDNTVNLKKISTGSPKYEGGKIADLSTVFTLLGCSSDDNALKRWVERWFVADPSGSGAFPTSPNGPPSLTTPEVYYAMEGDNRFPMMRFNISEISPNTAITKYGVGENADPWYARFGIDSTKADSEVTNDCNSPEVLGKLTADSLVYEPQGDQYDYEISAADRSGLPFLRRIGSTTELGSFADVATLRRQIAANFNDYCDADGVPTSDIKAYDASAATENDKRPWSKTLPLAAEPTYTGNEKTPYLYALGFQLGLFKAVSDTAPGVTTVFSGGKLSLDSSTVLKIAPMAKLANIYGTISGYTNFKAFVDPGAVRLKLRINGISFGDFDYSYTTTDLPPQTRTVSVTNNVRLTGIQATSFTGNLESLKGAVITANVAAGNFTPAESSLDPLTFPDVSSAYPHAVSTTANQFQKATPVFTYATAADPDLAAANIPVTLDGEFVTCALANGQLTRPPDMATDSPITIVRQPSTAVIEELTVSEAAVQPRRALLTADTTLPNGTAVTKVGADYVRAFPAVTAEHDFDLRWTTAAAAEQQLIWSNGGSNGLLVGGLFNYDPRQNLNNGDWYPFGVSGGALQVETTADYKNPTELSTVLRSGKYNGTANFFDPAAPKESSETGKDLEKEPADELKGPGWTSSSHLSTAFIRNAPMMSPWEIGFIHRGIRWQTINLKSAGDPDTAEAIQLTSYTPNESDWGRSGTTYEKGDGAILDQIKMTEQCLTYGKINVNLLRSNHPDFAEMGEYDKDMFIALFDQLHYGQPPQNLLAASTRNASTKEFDGPAESGTVLSASEADTSAFTASRDQLQSRAQFLHWSNGAWENAFGLHSTTLENDAQEEEIIGKTVNLITADTPVPTQIQMVVIAQSIRDVEGLQYRPTSDPDNLSDSSTAIDGMVSKNCSLGTFDAYIHSSDDDKNVYFDEITGEIKAFVTLERDAVSGRLRVQRIDYIE